MTRPAPTYARPAFLGAALALLTLLAYIPALDAGFIWDDNSYLTSNPVDTWAELWTRWSDPFSFFQYYPMVFTTFFVEHALWGLNPAGYHLVNVLLHGLSCLVLWRLLIRLGIPGSWLAAALFALHPICVESVAWVTERKNVLSALLYLSSFYCLDRVFDEKTARRGRWYLGAFALFFLAMTSKTVTATLPAAFLVVLWYKNNRLKARDWARTAPFFLLAVGMGLFSAWMEVHQVGAKGGEFALGFWDRFVLAGRVWWFYLGKVFWPVDFSFNYPRWDVSAASPAQWIFPVLALAVLALFFLQRKNWGRGPLAAALYYSGTLFPAIGFLNVFPFKYSYVADHFAYLAVLGPLVLLAGVFTAAAASRGKGGRSPARPLLLAAPALALGFLFFQTHTHARVYQNNITLFEDVLEKNPGSSFAHTQLGIERAGLGEVRRSRAHFHAALAVDQNQDTRDPEAFVLHEMACALCWYQRDELCETYLRQALELSPDYARAHMNLAVLLSRTDRLNEAVSHYLRALELDPGTRRAASNLVAALERFQARDANLAETGNPAARAVFDRAVALAEKNDVKGAVAAFNQALVLDPGYGRARYNLGAIHLALGRPGPAVEHLEQAAAANPESSMVRARLARAYALAGNPRAATLELERALGIFPFQPDLLRGLAGLYHAQGKMEQANRRAMEARSMGAVMARALVEVGQDREQGGDPARARHYYKLAQNADPSFAPARESLSRLGAARP